MTALGTSLGVTWYLNIHVASGPTQLKKRFAAVWGKTEVFVSLPLLWDITSEKSWRIYSTWSLQLEYQQQWVYGLRLERRLQIRYGDLRQHRTRLSIRYGDHPVVRGRFRLPYADLHLARQHFHAAYWLTTRLQVAHALAYAITQVNVLHTRFLLPWALLEDTHLQAVVNNPELVWQAHDVQLVSTTLSCDEDSPVWIASLDIAEVQDFARIAIGDLITLTLGLEVFKLIIDGKTLSRESAVEPRYTLSAVSPVARLEAPFAHPAPLYQTAAIAAHTAVINQIGPVDWQLPLWTIPAGRLMLQDVTPLAAARQIVNAIGGLLESQPDGRVICRRRHPISIPDYAHAAVVHTLNDGDIISSRAQIAPMRGFNRVTLANEEAATAASSDRIEYQAEDTQKGTVRVYRGALRAVQLVHTGHPATRLEALGEVSRTETERVEFIEGVASTRYPIDRVLASLWQHLDLGPLRWEGQTLTASTAGYSLLQITYVTHSLDWAVQLAAEEEVQFVLVDA